MLVSPIMIKFFIFFLMTCLICFKIITRKLTSKEKKETTDDDTLQTMFSKDDNGKYPWETDTDDSPDRINKTTRRLKDSTGAKRGRW